MLIGLVRHGETDWNAVKRIQGQTDIPLNEIGIQQAKKLGERLADDQQSWDCVITSDLQRAYATGEYISHALSVPMLTADDRLRERYFGQVEGTTLDERIQKWGPEWEKLDLGIEPNEEMAARGIQFMTELSSKYPNGNILCVSHGSFIAQLLLHLFPNIEDRRIENLSYTIIQFDGEKWELKLHGCVEHLV